MISRKNLSKPTNQKRSCFNFQKDHVILKIAITSMSARYAALVAMAQTNVQKSATSPKNKKDLGLADIRINKFEVLRLSFFFLMLYLSKKP